MLEVVRYLNGDKAPNPDGFSMDFFQQCLGGFERGHHRGFQQVSYMRKV